MLSLAVLTIAAGPVACPPECKIKGTSGDDKLYGDQNGPKDDVICGYGGNDELYGFQGNDILIGGPGNDLLDGGGGNDQVDYSGSSGSMYVNLALGIAFPWPTGPAAGNDTLVSIRRVVGTVYGDVIIGDDNDNVLKGEAGDDFLIGGSGADILRADGGNDSLEGQNGPDQLFGGSGFDVLAGGRGDDVLDGGDDDDWASYAAAPGGVVVGPAGASGADGADTLSGIENLEGSEYVDLLFLASPGVLRGLGGDDDLWGDGTQSTIDYSQSPAGVTVDLVAGTGSGGEGNDTLHNLKHITGSDHDDSLSGNNQRNTILGGDGDDVLFGKTNDDFLDGQAGIDEAWGGEDHDTCSAETVVNCEE